MPKEIVTAAFWTPDDTDPEKEGAEGEQPVAEVGWGRDTEHVQLVTRRRGYEVLPSGDHPDAYKFGQYVDLDRRGINDLIRKLRRARDQAFGRDE